MAWGSPIRLRVGMQALALLAAVACAGGHDSALIGLEPELAASSFAGSRGRNDFALAFSYGEASSSRLGLAAAVNRGLLLPALARQDFFDGAAHGWTAPLDRSVLEIQAELEATVPRPFLNLFDEAVARSWTEQLGGRPERVVPRVEAWTRVTGKALPLDGVRVGLQRAQGDQLTVALALAAAYPPSWQPALFEELGWRAGNDHLRWHVELEGFIADTPENMRCDFIHGAVRGRILHTGLPDEASGRKAVAKATASSPQCEEAAWQGLGWALSLRDPEGAVRAAQVLAPAAREQVVATIQALHGPQAPPPWRLL